MASESPFLDVVGPRGETLSFEVTADRATIGRLPGFNDIALEPDPQQLVSRKAHCSVEREAGAWWVIDNGSVNRTFIRRGEKTEPVEGKEMLRDGDVILVLGQLEEERGPSYWEISLRDPFKTRPVGQAPRLSRLEYDWVSARLFRVDAVREEITGLRLQEHKLVRFMDSRNRSNGGQPVMCTYEELLSAIWGNDAVHGEEEVNHLVWELRKKVEPDPSKPVFLQTVRGLGYRLVTT